MLRFAKYAAIGGVIAFVGAGVLGTVGSGLAWFAAPGVFGGMGLGIAWATIKVSALRSPPLTLVRLAPQTGQVPWWLVV